jgi:adenylate cyclase class IV
MPRSASDRRAIQASNALRELEAARAGTNLGIKMRSSHLHLALQRSLELGAENFGEEEQLDSYFRVARGRLKLRQRPSGAELISYMRRERLGPRKTEYRAIDVPAPERLKSAFISALGLLGEVEKSRWLLLADGIRIQLDQVPELGSFVELEASLEEASELGPVAGRLQVLRQLLELGDESLVGGSYIDEILERTD